jgi:hypothetical protein
MKFASFAAAGGASYGLIAKGGFIDVGAHLGSRYPTLRAAPAGDALGVIARTLP